MFFRFEAQVSLRGVTRDVLLRWLSLAWAQLIGL